MTILTAIKDALTSTPPIQSKVESLPADDSHNALKRWQLEQGRTRKRLEELTADLEAARLALPQSEQALGEQMVDGLDTAIAREAMTRAADHVRALESAVTIAKQRDESALLELQKAEQQAHDEKVAEARRDLAELGERGAVLLLELEAFSDDLAERSDALLKIGGNAAWSYPTNELRSYFDVFVMIAKRLPNTRGFDSGAGRKYKHWLHAVSAICGMSPKT